ncbi:MAG: hypothetical protein GW893_07885 [Armatimonadetes bacterium]|nr:hypothetical protein [Armatimonadota bacterium]PIU60345.1 MAG: hypothetical protein COS85_24980 [Armatimonadetes bacterium CG07_land_8_20_14_0_80_59_28]PIX45679.1 MAG: hypothetical protein COZ56_01350 [Armatimonadetes bacterium CG_4_8_14_3_um_filter_58_9]PIY39538.1 MAG: hypothetical protein COZ05_19130 [Armatimonadetes bacterium CG_4_10_14_3_um_filter_59_10]PJB77731.1 MAG: hypothetical protein CO095_01270 [Armatimonadetes bacterium CG_4_9_14_3_um_filter_58_7]
MHRPSVMRGHRGAALIEFALSSSLLFLLLLGIVEFGLIFKDIQVLQQAARVGARSAAVGNITSIITAHTRNSAISLDTSVLGMTLKYSTDNGATFSNTLGDGGAQNNAPVGSLIRVHLYYPHTLLTGYIIPGKTAKDLTSDMVVLRE